MSRKKVIEQYKEIAKTIIEKINNGDVFSSDYMMSLVDSFDIYDKVFKNLNEYINEHELRDLAW